MKRKVDSATLRSLVESQVPKLNDYAIGFAKPGVDHETVDAELGGSGTLVSIDSTFGILTANHVVEDLDKRKHVGLILPSRFEMPMHHMALNMEYCDRIPFKPPNRTSRRPDLCLLLPPFDILRTLKGRKMFYNLSKQQTRMRENPPALNDGFWVLSGYSQEWISDLPPQQGFRKGKLFKGMHGGGVVTRERRDKLGMHDYRRFGALYNELYEGPNKYGGLSGGGLWQLLVRERDGNLEIGDTLLSGVAFYESGKKEIDGLVIREITCHGRRSLYQVLIRAVRARPT